MPRESTNLGGVNQEMTIHEPTTDSVTIPTTPDNAPSVCPECGTPDTLLTKLTKDLREGAATLSDTEARFLVDTYYEMQGLRIRAANQVRSLTAEEEPQEPHATLEHFRKNSQTLENQVKSALDAYSNGQQLGRWARAQIGIGPVIAAGLLAHIDPTKPTAGAIWRFAGLDPSVRWEKGKKRPWNASLKTLCWKAGESFVKTCNHERGFYGGLYAERKLKLVAANKAGDYAETAARQLTEKKYGKTTEAFKAMTAGRLPDAQIHARARRYAIKIFLSHYHHRGYELAMGEAPPKPFILTPQGGHAHMTEPPPMVD